MKVRVAAVQTHICFGKDEETINLQRAKAYVKEAVKKGAQIVCFPESYPGPWVRDNIYSIREAVSKMASDNGIYIICGDLEPTKDGQVFHVICRLFDPKGDEIGIYRRTTPEGPWIYDDGPWHVTYIAGNSLPIFDTEYCRIGVLICSEVFVPELSKALAMQGAEIIFLPAGVPPANIYETWGTLVKARAYENNAATVLTKNIVGDEKGMCKIIGPEGPLIESDEIGVHVADIDLDRIRWLRSHKDKKYLDPPNVKPGLLTQWRNRIDLAKQYL
jgi:predicted amidohydrolase